MEEYLIFVYIFAISAVIFIPIIIFFIVAKKANDKGLDLIDKHGNELGLEIFNSNLSEDEFFKKDLKTDTIDKEQAKEKLKEAKENLSLELITQEEYDVLKEELKPIIMGDNKDSIPSEEIVNEVANNSKKGSDMVGWIFFIAFTCIGLIGIFSLFEDPAPTHKCGSCGDRFGNNGYYSMFGVINPVKASETCLANYQKGDKKCTAPCLMHYCSSRCARIK